MKLYDYLMDAENCKIVFLTGTPIIIILMKLLYYLICLEVTLKLTILLQYKK